MAAIRSRTAQVDVLKVFYRQPRQVDAPKLLLRTGSQPRASRFALETHHDKAAAAIRDFSLSFK
jgi:hypothetical protein